MKNTVFLLFLVTMFLTSCTDGKQPTTVEKVKVTVETPAEMVKRGEYLVTIMGCNDCHSPKKMGAHGPEIIPELMLSGYPADRPVLKFDNKLIKEGFAQFYPDLTAAAGPWGMSFAANITSDETGIGNWTEAQFKTAVTRGKSKGLETGRMLLPPMPWPNYTQMKNEDVAAVFTYLKSTKPVKNMVPAPIPPMQ